MITARLSPLAQADIAVARQGTRPESADMDTADRWPLGVRLTVMIGLSAGLWALIIKGAILAF